MKKTSDSGDRIPVAMYVRYACLPAGLKPKVQQRLIRRYATRHNMKVVASYLDFGKSGFGGRAGLKRLVADIQSGNASFKALLLSDVVRWGRSAEEGAYYELICRNRAIDVVYVSERHGSIEGSLQINILVGALRRSFARENEFYRAAGRKRRGRKMKAGRK